MRDLAAEPQIAYVHLGSERGQAFIGLIADFRASLFAADVPGGPISAKREGDKFELDWFISIDCTLKTIMTATGSDDDAWKNAHRIHLESITLNGEALT